MYNLNQQVLFKMSLGFLSLKVLICQVTCYVAEDQLFQWTEKVCFIQLTVVKLCYFQKIGQLLLLSLWTEIYNHSHVYFHEPQQCSNTRILLDINLGPVGKVVVHTGASVDELERVILQLQDWWINPQIWQQLKLTCQTSEWGNVI